MTRLNIILFFALIISSLGLVNSQHKARNLYFELEKLHQAEKQYDQEYGQLQLEQSTWAIQSRIEQVATQQLQMQVPEAARVQVVTLEALPTVAPAPQQNATQVQNATVQIKVQQ
ncbi:MAG: cell division protein FtsL [Methylophilaceae bacterium]